MPLIQWVMQNLNTDLCGGRGSLKIKFLPGNLAYDCHNKPWVVIGFEYDANKQQPVYTVTDNLVTKNLYETQLSNQPNYTNKQLVASEQLACLNSRPCGNSPVFSGRKKVKL